MADFPFICSQSHFLTAGQGSRAKWTSLGMNVNAGGGLGGRNCFTGNVGSSANFVTARTDILEMWVGCRYRTNSFANNPITIGGGGIYGRMPTANLSWSGQLMLANCGYSGSFYFGSGPAGVSSGPFGPFSPSVWYYLELYFKYVLASRVMTINAWVNEQAVLGSGVSVTLASDVFGSNNVYFDHFSHVCTGGSGVSTDFMDIYASLTGRYGDIYCSRIKPAGAGHQTNWTPDSGSNYARVQDATQPDDDTSYVKSSTPGDIDLYTLDSIPASGITVKAVQGLNCVKKSDSGTASVRTRWRFNSGNEYHGEEKFPSAGNYAYIRDPYEVSQDTGVAFTPTEINNLQYGQERVQ